MKKTNKLNNELIYHYSIVYFFNILTTQKNEREII